MKFSVDSNASLFRGLALGAGLMYFLDPQVGRRRRSVARDRAHHYNRLSGTIMSKASRDFNHRLRGKFAERKSLLRHDHTDDRIVVERVRSKIGRFVSHPRAIHIECAGGIVTLSGAVLAHELGDLLAGVVAVRGVHGVDNQLSAYSHPGDTPALQGRTHPRRSRGSSAKPSVRFVSDLIPTTLLGLIAYALTQRRYVLSFICSGLLFRFALGTKEPRQFSFSKRRDRSSEPKAGLEGLSPIDPSERPTDPFTYIRMYSHH